MLGLNALGLLFLLFLKPVIDPYYFLPFLALVLLNAWFYGFGAGLISAVISILAINFFHVPPVFSFLGMAPDDAGQLISFAVVSILVVKLAGDLRKSRDLFSATLSSIADAVIVTDHHGRITFLNAPAELLTGWTKKQARGKRVEEVRPLLNEKTREPVESPVDRVIREQSAIAPASSTILISRDGTEIPIDESAAPIRDRGGRLKGAILVFRDISARKQLQEQTTQTQKMEAVARLAGGVAGDFNNLLTIITGYSELLRSEMSPGNPLRRFAEEILLAAERAASLTRQLLSFGRGQAAQPKLLDLNSSLANMETMLRRLLGEKIELLLLPAPGLGRVKIDAGQFEQAIVNLAMNARDAMPDGGKFVLETANMELEDPAAAHRLGLEPGSYVMIAASDTGIGMDAETRSRLFEPFFTTKEQGRGSGLGLSAVYGIIKQSQGQITIYSQVDCGTIFEIYLPRVTQPATELVVRRAPRLIQGSETILLVDDEDGVRKLVSAVLTSNGYRVVEAIDGEAGLAAYERNPADIDLVLTDIVMPEMNGFELGQRLAERNANLKVLYMSGYRDNPIGHENGAPARLFLHKPFTPDVLLMKIREVLDSR